MSNGQAYKVESKEEIRVLAKGGEVETHYRIWATSSGGTYFHVEVAEDQLDKAPALLAARAKKLDNI
jgi:hypothetical protein